MASADAGGAQVVPSVVIAGVRYDGELGAPVLEPAVDAVVGNGALG